MEEINPSSEDKHEYNLKDFRPRRKKLPNVSDVLYVEDLITKALEVLQKASEVLLMVSKKFLTLFRTGKLGSFVLDVPDF
ncbi:hypothetical protein SLA2020_016450 [Shorea laevis]